MYVSGEGTEGDPYVHNVDIYYEEDGSERPSNVNVSYVGHNTFVADGDGIVSYNGDTYHHAGGYHTVRMTQCNGCPDPVGPPSTVDPGKGEQLPSMPSHGQKVNLVLADGTVTTLTYDAEYDAWVSEFIEETLYRNDVEIEVTKPQFQGEILGTLGGIALIEPSPVGELIWIGAATGYVVIYAYDVAKYYMHYTPVPNATDLPWQPGVSPGADWTWRGRTNNPEDGDGNWVRGDKPEMEHLNPDFDHPAPIGPHWDYTDQEGKKFRIFPDGTVEPK